jgi:hypothetical protein
MKNTKTKKAKIAVIDYSVGSIELFDDNLPAALMTPDEIYDYLNRKYEKNFKDSQCHYMIADELKITFNEERQYNH